MSATYNIDYFGLYQVNTKSDNLMLRNKPKSSANITVEMPKGSFIYCMGRVENNFVLCCYVSDINQYMGYCSTKYIKKIEE